jgi:hypothetical protein
VNQNVVLLCGLPASGKTTFLAALWYLLFHKEISTALTLSSFPQHREYLNDLSRKWSRFIPIDHTPTEEVQEIFLELKNASVEIDLRVPDLSGETWQAIWSTRFCSRHAAKWAQDSSGIMLFLHCDKINHPHDIMNWRAMEESAGQNQIGDELIAWSPDYPPTQVILVDILQTLTMPPLGSYGRRLAVIISAWDKFENAEITPHKYLRVYLPLLHQFLEYSGKFSDINIFGVSAQGGDFDSLEDAERLKAEDVPSKRIKVVEGDNTHHDLTVPIKWLIT